MAQVPTFNLYAPINQPEPKSKPYRGTEYSVREYSAMKPVEQHCLDAYCEYMKRHEKARPK